MAICQLVIILDKPALALGNPVCIEPKQVVPTLLVHILLAVAAHTLDTLLVVRIDQVDSMLLADLAAVHTVVSTQVEVMHVASVAVVEPEIPGLQALLF